MQQAEWEAMGRERTEAEAYICDVRAALERMRRAAADKEADIEVRVGIRKAAAVPLDARHVSTPLLALLIGSSQRWTVAASGLDAESHALDLRAVQLEAAREQSRAERQRAAFMEEVFHNTMPCDVMAPSHIILADVSAIHRPILHRV